MKVKIGIVPAVDKNGDANIERSYIDYIEKGGALPIALPYPISEATDEAIAECNGFLFLGGADVSPERYGESPSEMLGETIPARDEFEILMFERIFNTGKPIMAICRGMQLINCALGGALYQDLPTQLPTEIAHRDKNVKYLNFHEARFCESSYLYSVIGSGSFRANSYHHQAIKRLGEGLAVMASAPDGIIEAVYHVGERVLWGFQWHPERILDGVSERISAAFVSACGDAGSVRRVHVVIDRPYGSHHPKYKQLVYEANYGYVEGVIGGDGEEQDAYVLGIEEPIEEFDGVLYAVVHRKNDNENKWIVLPEGVDMTPDEILRRVSFLEKYFDSYVEVLK